MAKSTVVTVPQIGDWVKVSRMRKGRSYIAKGSEWVVSALNEEKGICRVYNPQKDYQIEHLYFDEFKIIPPPLVQIETEPEPSQTFDPGWDDPSNPVNHDLGCSSTLNDLGCSSTLNDEQAIATPDLGCDATLNLKKLLLWADNLPEKQLNQVIDALIGFRASKTPDTVTEDSHPSGSIEYKMINGCGPYRYLRYWSGGRYRSVYLGKDRQD